MVEEVLNKLSPQDEEMVVALPYRVGMFVSHSDASGGVESEQKEKDALVNILSQFSEDFCKSEVAQRILQLSVARKEKWPEWNNNLESVPKECEQAVDILSGIVEDKDVFSFKEIIIDVALSVAMAFRERDVQAGAAPNGSAGGIGAFFKNLFSGAKKPDPFEHMNVSPAEKKVLMQLSEAMNYNP